MSSYAPPPMDTSGGPSPFHWLRFDPQVDWHHVDLRVLYALDSFGAQTGQMVEVFSGYRSPSYSANVGGYASDPHTRGVAVDANVDGRPIGLYPGAVDLLKRLGLESGNQPGFYNGQTDPAHVQIPGSGLDKTIHAIATWITGGAAAITGTPPGLGGTGPLIPNQPVDPGATPPAGSTAGGCLGMTLTSLAWYAASFYIFADSFS